MPTLHSALLARTGVAPQHSGFAWCNRGRDPPLTLRNRAGGVALDYTWVDGTLPVVGYLAMPYEYDHDDPGSASGAVEPQPNEQWPSDHMAMGVIVDLARKEQSRL